MILYRKEKTNIMQKNCMMLEVDSGGWVYISKNVYDQAVQLYDRFEGEMGLLAQKLDLGDQHEDVVEYFSELAPEPLGIFAPFLALANENVKFMQDVRELCGALHQMAMVINFNEIVKVPKEVRVQASFSNSYLHNYEESWDSIETKLTLTEVDIEQVKLEAIEALLKRILPLTGGLTAATDNSGGMSTAAVKQSMTEAVAKNGDDKAGSAVSIPVEELDSIDFFADFDAKFSSKDTDDKSQEQGGILTEQIAKSMGSDNIGIESPKAVLDEAEKVKDLVRRFGGAKV